MHARVAYSDILIEFPAPKEKETSDGWTAPNGTRLLLDVGVRGYNVIAVHDECDDEDGYRRHKLGHEILYLAVYASGTVPACFVRTTNYRLESEPLPRLQQAMPQARVIARGRDVPPPGMLIACSIPQLHSVVRSCGDMRVDDDSVFVLTRRGHWIMHGEFKQRIVGWINAFSRVDGPGARLVHAAYRPDPEKNRTECQIYINALAHVIANKPVAACKCFAVPKKSSSGKHWVCARSGCNYSVDVCATNDADTKERIEEAGL